MLKDVTKRISDYVANLKFEQIDSTTLEQVKLFIADYIAACYAGYRINKELNDATLAILLHDGGAEESSVFMSHQKLPSTSAAFMNAVYAHGADMDDGNRKSAGHIATHVMPSVFAVAQATNAKWKDVIAAIVAGYDVFNRVAGAAQPSLYAKGLHSTGIAGGIACGAACAKLMGLDADGIYSAISLAALQSSGLLMIDESGQGCSLNQDHQTNGIAAQNFSGSNSDGVEDQHTATVGHNLGEQEGNDEENQTDQVVVAAEALNNVSNDTADCLTSAGVSQSTSHAQRTGDQHQQGQVQRTGSFSGLQSAAANHQDSADHADLPGGQTQLGSKDQSDSVSEEDDNAGPLSEGLQGLLGSLLLQSGAGLYQGFIGSKLGCDKDAVQSADNQHGNTADEGIQLTDHMSGVAVGFDVAVQLSRNGSASAQGQGAAGDQGNQTNGENDLAGLDVHSFSGSHSHGANDAENDNGALDQLGQDHGQDAVADHQTGQVALSHLGDCVCQIGAELGAIEASSDNAHSADHDHVAVAEVSQSLGRLHAAGDSQSEHGQHGNSCQTPQVGAVTDDGQCENDQTNG